MTGCELKKCTDYKDGKCHYNLDICKFRAAEINSTLDEYEDQEFAISELLDNGITQQEIDYMIDLRKGQNRD